MNETNLNQRKSSIGGSEVAAILGLDNYSSPYQVWLNKTGRGEETEDNKYMEAGRILESAVAEFFQIRTGYKLIKSSGGTKYTHPDYPFATGTPDRKYIGSKIGRSILECKTTQANLDDPLQAWFVQLQWYLGIVGFNNGSIAWLERGVDFKYREYEFDSEFFNYVMDIVADFWTNNVQKDIPPEPINVEDLNRMYKRHREGDFIQATDEIKVTCDLLKSINEQLKELEQKKEDYINSLKMVMRDAEGIVLGQIPLVTWKTSKPSLIFDKDRFKLENPELYSNYLIEKEGTRRFLIK